ncbi:MAG: hypothetical protein ACK4P1_06345 [Aggregatilineales bacterium]
MNYDAWNQKLLEYLTAGVPTGSPIYLTIDDEALKEIGASEEAIKDFEEAVGERCLFNGRVKVPRPPMFGQPRDEAPPYLAFLCAMALAAHRMGDEAHPNDFFVHFNKILRLQDHQGRPPGLENGVEEDLWKDWERWLLARGYQPTARRSSNKYIEYAISQALLRQTDRDNLWRYFNLSRTSSEDELIARLHREADNDALTLTQHLKRLLRARDERYESVLDAIRELYEAWSLSEPSERQRTGARVARSTLSAGLYRREDFCTGEVAYLIFPYQPRHVRLANARVIRDGEQPLVEERSGYFEPLWDAPVTLAELNDGANYELRGGGNYRRLNLPARPFWLLTQDDEGTHVFATWRKRPELGVPLILLGRADLESDLTRFKAEDMLSYEKRALPNLNGWYEYHLTLTSDIAAWNKAKGDQALIGALRPRQNLSIALSGGLADPRGGAWLTNTLPQVTVYALEAEATLSIKRAGNDKVLHQLTLLTGEPHNLPDLAAGNYELHVTCGGSIKMRPLRVIDWRELMPADLLPQISTDESLLSLWLQDTQEDAEYD